jgi:DNA sulfur modification protein DndD
MIFEELQIENFRQFEDRQSLSFAVDTAANVTVIHGFNGSGKTTLLNAFIWALYNTFTPDFVDTDRLESEAAFSKLPAGRELVTSVRLKFEDRGRRYTAERKRVVLKTETGERRVSGSDVLTLRYIDETGEVQEPHGPEDLLEQLMPRPLAPFFFFNGERIERLAGPGAYDEVKSGVKVLLDIEIFDRAIDHLNSREVAGKFRNEVAEHSGTEGKRASEERTQLLEAKEELEEQLKQFTKNYEALLAERDTIDSKLSAMPELAKWQAQREAGEREEKSIKMQLKETRSDIAKILSRHGYLVFAPDAIKEAEELLAAAHQKGELPVPMKRQFVDDLLSSGLCICGEKLEAGSQRYDTVAAWRDRVILGELEAAVNVTKAQLIPLFSRRDKALKDLDHYQKLREDGQRRLRELEEELSELSSKIGKREHGEDPVRLEARRRKIDAEVHDIKLAVHDKQKEIDGLTARIHEKDIEIDNLEEADARGKLAQRRLRAVSNVISAFEKIRALRQVDLRTDLTKRLNEVWSRIAIKDYEAELDEDYHLRLTKEIAGNAEPVRGASTGEKQVLSLAFIGSLVDKARSTYQHSGSAAAGFFQGGLYPLVMDSPFGSLEDEYRRDVAEWIPTLAPQVIVLVSESQWRREVEEKLHSKIGREWILECSTQKNRSRDIALHGREYKYVVESEDGFERTKLVEVQV